MTYPNEIEHEKELIRRGRLQVIKDIEDAERKDYYSSTQSGNVPTVEGPTRERPVAVPDKTINNYKLNSF